ncbi:MAG TPA: hypothetical protein VG815_20760 [Chloroflexota bacterium]|jgi:hypothetical protein|nr:hypothetical protein [Chloroflexota bacterium]
MPWLKRYHPTWILWQADSKGNPTRPAQSTLDPGPIVDFTNPQVQRYWMKHYIAPYLKSGFNGIAWDDSLSSQGYRAVGHFDTHHRFVRMYSGPAAAETWDAAQTRALGDFLRQARALEPAAQFGLNSPMECNYTPPAIWIMPMKYVHTIMDEEGYTFYGNTNPWVTSQPGPFCSNRWLFKTTTYIAMQKQGKQLVLLNEVPGRVLPYMTNTNLTYRAYLQWALANYYLVKYAHTYFWFGGRQQYGYPVLMQREELANIGRPLGDIFNAQGVYLRKYTKGMAIVNPSPNHSFTIALPHGMYQDLYGHNVQKLTMQRHTGIVLLTRT